MKMLVILSLFFSLSTFADSGTLILAHGSMEGDHHSCGKNPTGWEKAVIDSVENIRSFVKDEVQLAFGMWNTMCFDMGVKMLKKRVAAKGGTLDEINVLPLFISSYSTVIEMQKWMFGLKKFKPIPFLIKVKKVDFQGKVNYLKAIDHHQTVVDIIADRANSLAAKGMQEGLIESELELVIVMHGPVLPKANKLWMEMGNKYLSGIMKNHSFHQGHVVSLQDDAPFFIRGYRSKQLRKIVKTATANKRKALILPLLLSQGGIEEGILKRLKGLDYVWTGETVLPDPRLKNFFLERLKN